MNNNLTQTYSLSRFYYALRSVFRSELSAIHLFLIYVTLLVSCVKSEIVAAEFYVLGNLGGGSPTTQSSAISSDGHTVVGWSFSLLGREAFVWSAVEGLVGIGDLPGGDFDSCATSVSLDGRVVVGRGTTEAGVEAFVWTRETGMKGLGDLEGGPHFSQALGVSATGQVVIGTTTSMDCGSFGGIPRSRNEGFSWEAGGLMKGVGFLSDNDCSAESWALDVSADGSVIVGGSRYPQGGFQAFRWTSTTGMVGLGFLPNHTVDSESEAVAVSKDGNTIVGTSRTGHSGAHEAFIWTESLGMKTLGTRIGDRDYFTEARAFSGDGFVVAGIAGARPFLWDDLHGLRMAQEVMIDRGLSERITGWEMTSVTDISYDGNVLLGYGYQPDRTPTTWVAVLDPEPSVQILDPNTPHQFSIETLNSKSLFQSRVQAGRILLYTLSSDALTSDDSNALYLRWHSAPTQARWDYSAAEQGRASQRLVIPASQAGNAYLLVRADNLGPDGRNDLTLLLREQNLAIESVSTYSSAASSPATASLHGAGFNDSLKISLVGPGGAPVYDQARKTFVSPTRVDFEIDVGATTGLFTLRCEDPTTGESDEIPGAWTVTPGERKEPFSARLLGASSSRARRNGRLTLEYSNSSDREIPAPLLVVRGPPGALLQLESEAEPRGNVLQVLASNPFGPAGRLPAQLHSSIPVVFWTPDNGEARFELAVLSPTQDDYVGWERFPTPAGFVSHSWEKTREPLSTVLGATWLEYQDTLGRMALLLGRAGIDPASVPAAYELTLLEAEQTAGNAPVLGFLRQYPDGSPVAGVNVGALAEGSPIATGESNTDGFFTLECLERGRAYDMKASGYALDPPQIVAPSGGSPRVIAFWLRRDSDASEVKSSCHRVAQPLRLVSLPPDAPLTVIASHSLRLKGSEDPNQKDGPEGAPEDGLVGRGERVIFHVYFENLKAAESPAQVVVIEDDILPPFDPFSFEPLDVVVGGHSFSLDRVVRDGVVYPSTAYSGHRVKAGVVDRPTFGGVSARCEYDPYTRRAVWTLESIDPVTGAKPDFSDDTEGFLRPNVEPPQGEGRVSFAVRVSLDAALSAETGNEARIRFDANDWQKVQAKPRGLRPDRLPPKAPSHPSPADGSTRPMALDVTFSWSPDPNATSSSFQLWRGEQRQPELEVNGLTTSFFKPQSPLLESTRYFWKVTAQGALDPSPEWTFVTVPAAPQPPEAPTDLSPADGAEAVPARPLLSWRAAPGAVAQGYSLWLWREGEAQPPSPVITGVLETEYQLAESLLPDTAYLWQVEAENRSGRNRSTKQRFVTARPVFRRADVDTDGLFNITDAIAGLRYLFNGDFQPECLSALDVDDDGRVALTDSIRILRYLFSGEDQPPEPFERCGTDLTPPVLECGRYGPCEKQ